MTGLNKEPRLHFTEEERGNSSLEKPIRKAEKAAKRAERAQEKIPKRKIRKTIVEPDTGKVSSKLVLEEKKKPPSKLTYGIQDTPGKIITGKAHKEIRESEQDNVGVESAHKSEEMLETGGRLLREGYRSHKLKPYRKAAQAERRLEKANLQVLYQKAYQDNPALSSNPLSRWQQRQAIKKQYIAAKRTRQTAGTAAKGVGKTAKSAGNVAGRTGQAADFVRKHKKGALLLLALFLLVCVLMSMVSSCSMMASSIGSVVSGSTYPSKDEALLGAEDAYAAMEAELQSYLDNYERTHSYDEYHFDLDEIKHDPYVLMSLLTAYYQKEWTLSDVEGLLDTLFDRQYILTEEVEVETRYDSEDDPYDYYICYVTLENFDLSHLPVYFLSEEQLSLYAMYMQTLGNRPDLFPQSEYPNASGREEYLDYDVPPEALEDETFAAMLAEAEKYLGMPYVWGGSSPATSFDCSGFISWVLNHSGWNVGRLGAQGLYNICTPTSNPQPGDLVFFKGTYDTPGVSHWSLSCGALCGRGNDDPLRRSDFLREYQHQLLAEPLSDLWATSMKGELEII